MLLSLWAPGFAFAHAYLVKSVPAQRSVLLRAPTTIQLWFNEPIEPRYSTLVLTGASGANIVLSDLKVGGEEPKRISASVQSLNAGRYVVKYRVLSVDGHIAEDQFAFTVKR